jgi:hypothetical protein
MPNKKRNNRAAEIWNANGVIFLSSNSCLWAFLIKACSTTLCGNTTLGIPIKERHIATTFCGKNDSKRRIAARMQKTTINAQLLIGFQPNCGCNRRANGTNCSRVSSCRINVPTIWFRGQFGSEGNFEVQLCENTPSALFPSALFPMLFDENDVIVGIPKDLVYQVVDRKLIQRADLKYNQERILAPCYFPCFSFRILSSLWFRKTRCTKLSKGVSSPRRSSHGTTLFDS